MKEGQKAELGRGQDGGVGIVKSREGRHPFVDGVACHIGWSATSGHRGRRGERRGVQGETGRQE